MIQTKPSTRQRPQWQRELARAFTKPADLLDFLRLPAQAMGTPAPAGFPMRVPRGYAVRMRPGDPEDPLLRQVWPHASELADVPGFTTDAVGDLDTLRAGGIIHKYQGRALVIASGACAVHCRYCFRRHFPYADATAARGHWEETLRELASDRTISEVILSGGDPLSVIDERLSAFAEALEFMPHIRRLRIHTRLPVVLPERVDDPLLAWLGRGRVRRIIVLHFNHPREIDAQVSDALARLRSTGAPLFNQSVLLKGINDSVSTLVTLSEALFDSGVMPYYLHMLDRVRGTAHFEVPEPEARALARELTARLPGYLVPRLVREVPGAASKIPLGW